MWVVLWAADSDEPLAVWPGSRVWPAELEAYWRVKRPEAEVGPAVQVLRAVAEVQLESHLAPAPPVGPELRAARAEHQFQE